MEQPFQTSFVSNSHGARACDDCRTRKIKCKTTAKACESCEKRNVSCTFVNPILKRGPKPRKGQETNGQSDSGSTVSKYDLPGMNVIPPTYQNGSQANAPSQQSLDKSHDVNLNPQVVPDPSLPQITVKSDQFGSLIITIDAQGKKMAIFYLCTKDSKDQPQYNPVSSTSLDNHPLSYLDQNSCKTHQVLGLLTSQQIYIAIIFFTHVYPHNPTLDLKDFDTQLREPMTTSLLFLLNCICAIACPYGSNAKARFDKTQFYYKALELNYYNRDTQLHPNWKYGHTLLKLSKQTES